MRWIAAGLLVSALATAGEVAELPPDLRKLAGLAASLPPEFQADALLQMVESHGGLDAPLKKDLLEQAFTAARQSRIPYPKTGAYGVAADSRQGFEAAALALKLDRLSLEMRTIRAMMSFDPISARQMFQRSQRPAPPEVVCGDALVPQLDDYYDMGAQVVARGFTPKEITRQEHVALLLHIVEGVKAPFEIGPAARMISHASLTPTQFEAALTSYTGRLEAMGHDDRSFSETALATQQEIGALAAYTASMEIPNATLAGAYRKYLTSRYAKARCGDSAGARIAGTPATSPADWFNQSDLRGDLPKIDIKELRVRDPDGKLTLDAFWSSPDSAKILIAAQGLRTSPGGVFYGVLERSSTEWNQKLQEFLAQLGEWKQSGEESELDFFNEKATVYQALIDLCPAGDARQRMIGAFVDFLKGSNVSRDHPVDWFWHAQNLYRRLRRSGDSDAARLMMAYKASGNLTLEVYAQLNGR